ncbi:MAG: outer membrane beta-barrel protein [Endomicrobiaceae bacterium]|nr:outer membrane beta-barrel protein [Endomicrobiaceae bacterium]
MKKSILAVLLMFALVVPALTETVETIGVEAPVAVAEPKATVAPAVVAESTGTVATPVVVAEPKATTVAPIVVAESVSTAELVVKVGYGLNAQIKTDGYSSLDVSSPFMIGAEGYMYVTQGLGLGLGINNIFDADIKDEGAKIGVTNIYFSVKPKLGFADVYLLGQVGYGLVRIPELSDMGADIKNGMYWGVGAGVELMSFVVELLYSNNNFTIETSPTYTYSMIAVNVGYKFLI